ncbi:hypothetical protein HG535_0B00980 [Zygotorulaspora mrakii]|uniref:PHD-type domain-containing protein n=1 Tax=Zygotorulaspora mrakii TaxID=42260 RepID=A0A7H9AXB9_ZYGMR|nr:uncharacterized protein HG535_0B00980 [Zygotorulaspora mrakii]QLG71060.1 hypothetical protein HG535_0B00980 [Zygotorulaspora mrakii]
MCELRYIQTETSQTICRDMAHNDSKSMPKQRAGTRSVNYSEKEADADLIRRIDQFEKVDTKSKPPNRVGRPRSNKSTADKNGNTGTSSGVTKNKHQSFLNDKAVGWNFIPVLPPNLRKTSRFSNILDLKDALVNVSQNTLKNSDRLLLKAGDTIYMVSEPPGEPYYIGRVVQFVPKVEFSQLIDKLKAVTSELSAKYFHVKMNWFYRSRDIQDKTSNFDTRLVYASLHEDICPIISYRGKCTVLHVDEFENENSNTAEFITRPNVFYFDQLFDRYSLAYYNVVSSEKLLTLHKSSPFLYLLSKRFRYMFIEDKYPLNKILRKYVIKDNTSENEANDESWDDRCSVCREWCRSSQRLKCDECYSCVHLHCMDPPLEKKPNKGIIWLCFNCLKRHEGTSEALRELNDEQTKQTESIGAFKDKLDCISRNVIEEGDSKVDERHWFQYMGQNMICHLEDLLQRNFYIPYPFKNSRIGIKYQWAGNAKFEKWEPVPYSTDRTDERGSDQTSDLLWVMEDGKINDGSLEAYIQKCKDKFPAELKIMAESCNFLDMITKALMDQNYSLDRAFSECKKLLSRESLREPTFSTLEVEKFENAVAQYGSELHLVCKDVDSQPMSSIVRYYYYWKKTENGQRIWGGFKGRPKNKAKLNAADKEVEKLTNKGKSPRERKPTKLALENKNTVVKEELKFLDESCFETENLSLVRTCFKCVFCDIDYSPLWYKITGGCDDEHVKNKMHTGFNDKFENKTGAHKEVNNVRKKTSGESNDSSNKQPRLDALCIRCARLWRRYGIKWQPPVDILKRLSGNSMYVLNSNIDQALEERNANVLTSKPEQARNKLLEWEQVTDSEFILRQRPDFIQNPDHFAKLKTNTLSSRSALYRLAKKPIDKNQFNIEHSRRELENLLATVMRKQAKTIDHRPKSAPVVKKEKQETATKSKSTPQGDLPKKSPTPPILTAVNYGIDLNSGGDIQIEIPSLNGKLGTVTIKNNFEKVIIDEILLDQLKRLSTARKRTHFEESSILSFEPSLKARKIDNDGILGSTSNHDPMPMANIRPSPEVVHENSTTALLRAYRNSVTPREGPPGVKFSIDAKRSSNDDIQRSEYCSVCRQKFEKFQYKDLCCHNCGMRVHYCCYGANRDKENFHEVGSKNSTWICDPCSNDLNPSASTNYKCVLCYSKNREFEFSKNPNDGALREALKCTNSGSWAHAACAIFNKDIKFGSASSLQPIMNTKLALMKNSNNSCGLCGIEGGGLVKCDLCERLFHVTCSQKNPGFSLVFKMADIHRSDNEATVSGNSHYFTPVLLCNDHQMNPADVNSVYASLDTRISNKSSSLMNIFMSSRNYESKYNMVYERYLEQRECEEKDTTKVKTDGISENVNEIECTDTSIDGNPPLDDEKVKEAVSFLQDLCTRKKNESRKSEQTDENFCDFIQTYTSKSDSYGNRGEELSEAEVKMLMDGINPDDFDIQCSKDGKESKRKKQKNKIKELVNSSK